MNTTLGSWNPMTQPQRSTRRAVTAGVAILAVIATAVVIGIALWPNDRSPSGDGSKGPDLTLRTDAAGIELPVSRTAGPRELKGGLAKGFARSELGAALAAIHISTRAAAGASPSVFEPTIRDQVTGNDAAALLSRAEAEYEAERSKLGIPDGRPLPKSDGRIVAYDIVRYNDAESRVTVISGFESDATKFFAFDFEIRWIRDDWRLVAPSGGTFATAFSEIPSIPPDAVVF